jgi:hypothetical protein
MAAAVLPAELVAAQAGNMAAAVLRAEVLAQTGNMVAAARVVPLAAVDNMVAAARAVPPAAPGNMVAAALEPSKIQVVPAQQADKILVEVVEVSEGCGNFP